MDGGSDGGVASSIASSFVAGVGDGGDTERGPVGSLDGDSDSSGSDGDLCTSLS